MSMHRVPITIPSMYIDTAPVGGANLSTPSTITMQRTDCTTIDHLRTRNDQFDMLKLMPHERHDCWPAELV
eukprot:SAG31_NODE_1190_length_9465_cov_4.082746_3_plen_71_part_00